MKKYLRRFLTFLQAIIILLWLATGLGDVDGFNFMKFNILPIPMVGDMIVFAFLILIVLGIQKLKDRICTTQIDSK